MGFCLPGQDREQLPLGRLWPDFVPSYSSRGGDPKGSGSSGPGEHPSSLPQSLWEALPVFMETSGKSSSLIPGFPPVLDPCI